MNRSALTLVLAATCLVVAAALPAFAGENAAAPVSAPAPSSSASGLDLAAIDQSIKPGNNFFMYANGNWYKQATIPPDRSSVGTFYTIFKRTQKRTADIIRHAGDKKAASGSKASKVARYYAAWMDKKAIRKHGLKPLKPELAVIGAIDSRKALAKVLGSRLRQDVDPINATHFHTEHLFGLFVAQGLTDPSHNIAYLLQGGLALPSRDYYLSSDKTMAGYRAKYKTYIANLLEQAGIKDAKSEAKRVFKLEKKIAQAQESLTESENVHKANNLWSRADFGKKAPGLDWPTYFKAAGLADQKVIDAWQPKAIAKLSKLAAKAPLKSWKALLTFHTLDHYAPVLPKPFAKLSFEFHKKTLQGVPEQKARWKRAVAATNHALGFAVGKLYVEKYFPPSAKAKIQDLVHNLIAAFGARIHDLTWMQPETKKKTEAKLKTLKVKVGYPESWPSYKGLTITDNDPLTNAINAEKFHTQQRLAVLGKPVNRDHWWMNPQLVNAINLPLENELQFPAAILQPPFFNPKADAAHNYGAIGAIIGHEISHSFDNMGSQFDAQGRLHNWWTKADAKHFKELTQRLAKQYSQYEPLPGVHINGEQTLGEDIADVSGLTVSHAAYHRSLDGKPAPMIDGLTGDQRFFLAFAQAWQSKIRPAALRQRLKTDVHAPGRYRAETVRNLDAWYKAFDIPPDAKLYLKPNQRVQIW
jgi:putative endopeptidase